jgi:hypothetical protein
MTTETLLYTPAVLKSALGERLLSAELHHHRGRDLERQPPPAAAAYPHSRTSFPVAPAVPTGPFAETVGVGKLHSLWLLVLFRIHCYNHIYILHIQKWSKHAHQADQS